MRNFISLFLVVCSIFIFNIISDSNNTIGYSLNSLDVGDAGHKKYCIHCQYYRVVNHIWQNYPFGGCVCSICGHITGLIYD